MMDILTNAPALCRRDMLGVASIIGAAAMAGSDVYAASGRASVPAGVDLKDPAFNLSTLTRLQGDVRERVTYGFQYGQVYGLLNAKDLPLNEFGRKIYSYEGGGVRKARLLPDGSVQSVSRGWLFYTDPVTDEYITSFVNPYTNESVEVPVFRAGISGDTATINGPKTSANFTMESTVYGRPPQLEYKFFGDRAWISRYAFTRWQPRGQPNKRIEMTLDVWDCARGDVFNARKSYIPSRSTWTSQTEFQTWLKMPADIGGHQLWRADGVRVNRIADLPERFVARCMADPAIAAALTDPLVFPA
jgi:Protein of unknown function (DUF1838)